MRPGAISAPSSKPQLPSRPTRPSCHVPVAQHVANLHGGGNLNDPKVLAEYKEIEDALRFEREQAETSFGALVKPRIVKRVVLGMSIQMWSQLCGMNIMMYYIVFIMRGAGIADELLTASIQ